MFIIAKVKNCWIILPRGFRHFIKYSIIGATSASIDFFIYWALTRFTIFFGEHYLIANAISFLTATGWGFIWNKKWTFENKDVKKIRQYLKYIIICGSSLLLSEAVLYGLVKIGVHDIIAKLCVGTISWAWNFTMNKYWTFKEKF
jgi:putative flippase GtrA